MKKLKVFWQRLAWAVTPPARKRAQLTAALDMLADIPEAAALLDMAAAKGIAIRFDGRLIGGKTTGVFTRSAKPGRTRISLKPGRRAGQTAATLVHELRHMWQAEVLGLDDARDLRGEYTGPMTKIMVTRVKEADAYAFTHYIVRRVARMDEDLAEAADMALKLREGNAGLSLTPEQIAQINAHFQEKCRNRHEEEIETIRRRFLEVLDDLDSYDRRALRKYHALYTHPDFTPKEKPSPDKGRFDMGNLRRILRAGVEKDAPEYMTGIADATLKQRILAPVAKDVRQAARLMTAFEKAASDKRLTAEENLSARKEIHARIRDVTAVRRKKR